MPENIFENEELRRIDQIIQTYVIEETYRREETTKREEVKRSDINRKERNGSGRSTSSTTDSIEALITIYEDLEDIRKYAPQNYRRVERYLSKATKVQHKKLEKEFRSLEALAQECEFRGHFEKTEEQAIRVLERYTALKNITGRTTRELETYSKFIRELRNLDEKLESISSEFRRLIQDKNDSEILAAFASDAKKGLLGYYEKMLPRRKRKTAIYTDNSSFIKKDAFLYDIEQAISEKKKEERHKKTREKEPTTLSEQKREINRRHTDTKDPQREEGRAENRQNYQLYIVEQHINGAYGGKFEERLDNASEAAKNIRITGQEEIKKIEELIEIINLLPVAEHKRRKTIRSLEKAKRKAKIKKQKIKLPAPQPVYRSSLLSE